MLEAFVGKIVSLAAPNIHEKGLWEYTDKPLRLIQHPIPDPIEMKSLSGLIEYLAGGRELDFLLDSSLAKRLFIHVESPTRVSLYSGFNTNWGRNEYIRVSHDMPQFQFGITHALEEFIVGLQAKFVPTADLQEVLKVVGNMKDEHITTMKDDGVSQRVTVSAGAANVENKIVPNPVTLAPWRTFPDIDQPESQFVLRIRAGGGTGAAIGCALHEADGEQWKVEAMQNIKTWLEYEIQDMENPPVILA